MGEDIVWSLWKHSECRAHPRKTRDNLTNDDVAGTASITRLSDTVIAVKHGQLKILKDRNEGNVNVTANFYYYPDCKICEDINKDAIFPDFAWDKSGVPMPDRIAASVYRKIMPEMEDFPI